MKFSKAGWVFFFAMLLSITVLAQTDQPEYNPAEIAKIRAPGVKADILQEIQTLDRKNQASFYAELGEILLDTGDKEGAFWLAKSVEIAVSPATVYRSEAEKLIYFWRVLHHLLENDAALADKLIVHLKQIKVEESDAKLSERGNSMYIHIADQILSRKEDDKLAFELAMLSLKGKSPAVEWRSAEFFRRMKAADEKLANDYFAKLIEILKTTGDPKLISFTVHYFADPNPISNFPTKDERFRISDAQRKALLDLLVPLIQKNAAALASKKNTECGAIIHWGLKFLDDYKRLSPEKSLLVEQSLAVCQNADIAVWKKPDFHKKPRETSADWLNLAKEITDQKVRVNYLQNAERSARKEGNYRLSESILESIDPSFREESWKWAKIETSANLFDELFKKNDFAGANGIFESLDAEYRPFAALHWLQFVSERNSIHKDFILNLMSRTRADFNKMNPARPIPNIWSTHPTRIADLTRYYVKFGFYEQAIETHEESIKSLNVYINALPAEYKTDRAIPRFGFYSRFTNQAPPADMDFIYRYFDRIYENLGKIENQNFRLSERLMFLRHSQDKPPTYCIVPLLNK